MNFDRENDDLVLNIDSGNAVCLRGICKTSPVVLVVMSMQDIVQCPTAVWTTVRNLIHCNFGLQGEIRIDK